MRNLPFLLTVTLLLSSAALGEERPNILFLFADDMCFQTVHEFGHEQIETPQLDRLAQRSTTFTHAYNMGGWNGAVCIASRTMLNTGRFLWHAQAVDRTCEDERAAGRLWSEYLKQAGYRTYMTGKWHIQAKPQRAFDVARNVRGGMPATTESSYNRPLEGVPDTWDPADTTLGGYWSEGKHLSEITADDACDYLQEAKDRDEPFFMYVAFNAPHDPRQAPQSFLDKYPVADQRVPVNFLPEYPFKEGIGCDQELRDEKLLPFPRTAHAVQVHRREYFALISHLDSQIGRVLDALEASGKLHNTWIFFTADHGLAVGQHGLVGKQNMYEHSVRVPFLVAGPGVPPGEKNPTPIYLQDVMPTTLELAGIAKPDHVEFRSLLPLLRGETESHYEAIYGAYLALQRMVSDDGYKLILYPKLKVWRLYRVADDPYELHDLAAEPHGITLAKPLFERLLKLQDQTGDTLNLRELYPQFANLPPDPN